MRIVFNKYMWLGAMVALNQRNPRAMKDILEQFNYSNDWVNVFHMRPIENFTNPKLIRDEWTTIVTDNDERINNI